MCLLFSGGYYIEIEMMSIVEDRRQRTEDRGQISELGSRNAEVGKKAKVGRWDGEKLRGLEAWRL